MSGEIKSTILSHYPAISAIQSVHNGGLEPELSFV
jgi:hypothetical protein